MAVANGQNSQFGISKYIYRNRVAVVTYLMTAHSVYQCSRQKL